MIAYDLQCENSHTFEGWFEDEKEYRRQKRKEMISCPVCETVSVSRIPSTFAVKSQLVSREVQDQQKALAEVGKKVAEYVDKNFDDVGTDFSKEALKIHYGASEPRNIRGVSTKDEEKTLKEEGVQFFKFPMPASDKPKTDA